MAGSPFDKKGGSTATAATEGKSAGKADPSAVPDATNLGEDKPISKGDPFAAADPAGISGYKVQDFLDQLILVHPTESGKMATTISADSEYVRVDLIPLTAPEDAGYEAGERIDDVLVFQTALRREFNKALDNGTAWLLGRLTLGNKKPGQSPPYILVAGSDEDKAIYQEWRAQAAAKA